MSKQAQDNSQLDSTPANRPNPTQALLRAIADKLIPGIPEQTRVAILQQTSISDATTTDLPAANPAGSSDGPNVLEDVVDKATAKSDLEQEINSASHRRLHTCPTDSMLTSASPRCRRQQHRPLRRPPCPAQTPP